MKKTLNILLSPMLMAALLFFAAFFMGFATIIENDYGAAYARESVYEAWWFELILVLLAVNLVGSIFTRKLYTKQKFPIFMFHFAFTIMLIGAGLTRYVGYEGIMHIREGATSNEINTDQKGLIISIEKDNETVDQQYVKKELHEFGSFSTELNANGNTLSISAKNYSSQAYASAMPSDGGKPTIGFVVSGNGYRGFNYIQLGETKTIAGIEFSYSKHNPYADILFSTVNDTVYINSKSFITVMQMMGNQSSDEGVISTPLTANQLYKTMNVNIVAQEILESAVVIAHPAREGENKNLLQALQFDVSYKEKDYSYIVWENSENSKTSLMLDDINLSIGYGKRVVSLPFSLTLNDFQIDRYPGSNSPSSFSSFVTINEEGKDSQPFHIYMNNILKMNGFRFFQSSYDEDEKGTILSVNYDIWGTTVTYIGYFMLFIGIILSLLSKNTFFHKAKKIIKPLAVTIGFITIFGLQNIQAREQVEIPTTVSAEHAEIFGKLLIQNQKGRTEPIYTFASGVVRKISRSESLYGLTPAQTFLELSINGVKWSKIPIIKVTHPELQKFLGVSNKYMAYTDFINEQGQYKLQQQVNESYNKAPSTRSKYDKAVIKTDEKINICYSIFTGRYLQIFPAQDSSIAKWLTPVNAYTGAVTPEDSTFLINIMPAYYHTLGEAKESGDYTQANELIAGIEKYQKTYALYNLPDEKKVSLELFYYKWNVFKKLFPLYALLGFVYLIILITGIIRGIDIPKWVKTVFTSITFVAFIGHTLGLAIRWYVSGHAPMSNGYESMIFVSWVTILAGFIFNKQTSFALSATLVLASMTLMVANLSFMDPEITNLVPVLKSYWLTLHVSIITGSYSFLGFGAILGIINQILFITKNKRNAKRIDKTIHELTVTNHQTLIVGLYFLTIGTFLGAIWANESWGRYWGWDPKETWSLITIIVYTFVTHLRMIPGLKGIFIFNVFSLYGFAAVLMTYFGVNYYLSGMHSYAGGDPVPVPTFVYYSIAILFSLSAMAWINYNKQAKNKV